MTASTPQSAIGDDKLPGDEDAAEDFATAGEVDKAARKAESESVETANEPSPEQTIGRPRSRGEDPQTGR